MEIKVDIKIPSVPTHISLVGGDLKVHICHLSEEELREIGKEWTDELVRVAKEGTSIR